MTGNKKYPFPLDEGFKKIYLEIRRRIREDDTDVMMIFGGDTGSGKSLAAMRAGYVISSHKMKIDFICMDAPEFIDAILKSKKGQVLIADEAISMFFSRAAMTKEGRLMQELMTQIRQKNLCVILCVPDVLTLDKLILDKSAFYIHTYEKRIRNKSGISKTIKGNLHMFFDSPKYPAKTLLIEYLRTKRANPHKIKQKRPRPILRMKGSPLSESIFYPVDEKEYRAKKSSILEKYRKKDKTKENPELVQLNKRGKKIKYERDKVIYLTWLYNNKPSGLSWAEKLNLDASLVRRAIIQGKKGAFSQEK